jgi:hypothetical protein
VVHADPPHAAQHIEIRRCPLGFLADRERLLVRAALDDRVTTATLDAAAR